MKKLIALISSKGKSQEQISNDVKKAYQKYQNLSTSKGTRCWTIVGCPKPRHKK